MKKKLNHPKNHLGYQYHSRFQKYLNELRRKHELIVSKVVFKQMDRELETMDMHVQRNLHQID